MRPLSHECNLKIDISGIGARVRPSGRRPFYAGTERGSTEERAVGAIDRGDDRERNGSSRRQILWGTISTGRREITGEGRAAGQPASIAADRTGWVRAARGRRLDRPSGAG